MHTNQSPQRRCKRIGLVVGAQDNRRGAAVVEMAVVTPIIFLIVFACVEFGRMIMVVHGLEAAAREGCRTAVGWEASKTDVEDVVEERLAAFGITQYTLTLEPESPASACQWEPIRIQITVSYPDVSWLPAPRFLQGITLSGTCSLPQEADRCSS